MGISPGGAMTGADIVVGWVREGEVNIQVGWICCRVKLLSIWYQVTFEILS